jgi:hypothetical protein
MSANGVELGGSLGTAEVSTTEGVSDGSKNEKGSKERLAWWGRVIIFVEQEIINKGDKPDFNLVLVN